MRWAPRVTVAAIIENEGRFLFVQELQSNLLVLNQPAGHLEDGESCQDAVIREVLEESGWQFLPESVVGIYRWVNPIQHDTYFRICFSGSVINHDPERSLDEGIVATLWLKLNELTSYELRSPMVTQCIDDYLAGNRFPLSILNDIN
jgi:8-oxo-dGTP pyrophosphatase MutT (NUDIX family)